nr:hypothetical protein [Tanacetum cinerariifolium]
MAARGQNHGNGKNKQAYAPKPKIPPPPKRENLAKDSICYECGEGLRASQKLKLGTLSLYVGNGQREAVEAIGAFYLFLPSGLEIVLNNCHYASVILRDGIFEIDLSNSLTNESYIYAVSNKRAKLDLDSALLWHCRLEHISKKCIEKLQHDGLFDSSDLRAFEKCVSCMSGKMARKPYTHHVERAKDLLGPIYTDVCGSFKIMSRQGASYFVTFTGDFSRASIMSQESLDHLKDHWIIAHRTPPYTSQHNGVSVRTNRTLLDMVRSMMSQTTLSKSFWDYALETAARILNMVPTKKVETTPYERSLINQEASGSVDDLKIIQEEYMHPSIDTSLNHEEDDLEIDEPQSDIVPIRRSTRRRHAPDRMCLYIDAEEHELGDLDNEVWFLVELPPNGKIIGSEWLFKKKTDMDGNVHIYKARLVAKGYTQTPWIDYEETFSPVADIRVIRILIAIAAYYDYEIWQMNVKTAFLNGYLNEEVYMEQPEGFVNLKYPNHVCKLKRSIYGLKQASRQWNKRFDDEIKKLGFTQNRDEPCVYLKASGSNITFLILYVIDILIMGNNIPMSWKIFCHERSSAYIKKILKRYCMENSKRGSIPVQEKLKLNKSQGASTPAELKCMQNVPYASAVGFIMYPVRCTRPDVAFAHNVTSRFQKNPCDIHWTTVKNILTYLKNTKDMFLVYGEAEYIATFDASKEAVWVKKVISGLGVVPIIEEPISMYCDNTGEISIANESGITKGARHFRANVHYLWEVIEYGDIKLEKVHTDDNLADPFTKALAFPKHSEHTRNIRMLPASSLM